MLVYYTAYFGGLTVQALCGTGRQNRMICYWALLVAFFLFVGFRDQVGCDWWSYLRNWNQQIPRDFASILELSEPGYWLLIETLQLLGLPYIYLNVVTTAMFFIGLHALAIRQPNPLAFLVLALPILIINMPMSAVRQGAAIGFVALAFVAFIDRSLIRYVLWVIVGSLFHSSALLFLLLSPFVFGAFTKKNLIISAMLAAPGVAVLAQSDSAELASDRYINTGIDAAGAAYRLGLLAITGAAYFLFIEKRWRRLFPVDYKLMSVGALLMVAFAGMFAISTVIGDRFGYYLIPIQLMLFARLPYLYPRGQISIFPYVILTLVFIVWTQNSVQFENCYIPYGNALF